MKVSDARMSWRWNTAGVVRLVPEVGVLGRSYGDCHWWMRRGQLVAIAPRRRLAGVEWKVSRHTRYW